MTLKTDKVLFVFIATYELYSFLNICQNIINIYKAYYTYASRSGNLQPRKFCS